jgi:DNA-directed RNA polymerase specialized sigma subunit
LAKKRGRKRRTNHYFTEVHQKAIVDYNNSPSRQEREQLAQKYIIPAFSEMVDKIVFTFKFNSTLPNSEDLRDECKIWLITVIDKFDEAKGYKAFSYFSVITKNWFIQKVKQNNSKRRRETYFDELPKQLEEEHLSIEHPYHPERESREFWENFYKEVKGWPVIQMKPNEKRVYDAMMILFEDADNIEIFNKKAIYLYVREITGLNTKQVVNNLNKLRVRYRSFRKNWDNGDI